MERSVRKAGRLAGEVRVPGDKSIAHRALILGAAGEGEPMIDGLPSSEDVASTKSCLEALRTSDGALLFAGNSGTSARLLSGLIAGRGIPCVLDGDASLRKRPMERVAEPLRMMGARIETAAGGHLPMEFKGGGLKGVTYELPVASAQVKSAVLLAGLFAKGVTCVIEKTITRDHTERMLAAMGVPIEREGDRITLQGWVRPRSIAVSVPGDFSSAVFFMAAALLVPGSKIRLPDVGVNPTRTGALEVLERMGGKVILENEGISGGEPRADISVQTASLKAVNIEGAIIPRLIDELPVLAVLATQAEGRTEVRGAKELRYKESDRIRCVKENLTRLGVVVEEREDGFVIEGPCSLKGGAVSSFGDHRMAMAMAVAGLIAEGETRIEGSEAVGVSYPGFFEELDRLVQ